MSGRNPNYENSKNFAAKYVHLAFSKPTPAMPDLGRWILSWCFLCPLSPPNFPFFFFNSCNFTHSFIPFSLYICSRFTYLKEPSKIWHTVSAQGMFIFLLSCTKIFFSLPYLSVKLPCCLLLSYLHQNLLKSLTLIPTSISSHPINDSPPSILISILQVTLKLFSLESPGTSWCTIMKVMINLRSVRYFCITSTISHHHL